MMITLMFIIRTATYLLILVLAVNMLTIVIWSWDFDGEDNDDDDDDGVDDDGLYLDDDDDRRQPGRRCGCAGGRQGHTALQRPPYLHTTLVGGMMPQLEDTTVSLQYFTSPSSNTPMGNIDTFHWRLPESSTALAWMPWLDVLTRRNLDKVQQWQLLHFHSCHLLWMNPRWYATEFRDVFFCPPKTLLMNTTNYRFFFKGLFLRTKRVK